MLDFVLGFSFVAMILSPSIAINWHLVKAHRPR